MIKICLGSTAPALNSLHRYRIDKAIRLFTSNKQVLQTQSPNIRGTTVLSTPIISNLPSHKTISKDYQTLSSQAKRIQFQIFRSQLEPAFIKQYIQNSKAAKAVKDFNPSLTNGGQTYDEFPLIKLLSIALRSISQQNIDKNSWRQLQFFIRKRLHRCTIQQNLKLLYIMLKSFPVYSFDYSFILSICLALKKQINLMNNEQLKMMYYVLSVNKHSDIRYHNSILANLQSLILIKVLQKSNKKLSQQKQKHVHLPMEYLYSWITYGLTLSLRNNYFQLVFEEKAVDLMQHFNQKWKAAVLKQQHNRIIHESEIPMVFYMAAIYRNIVKYYSRRSMRKGEGKEISFKDEFQLFIINLLAHTSKKISRIIANSNPLESIRTFRSLIQLYTFQLVQNIIELPQQQSNNQNNAYVKYPKLMQVFTQVMKPTESSREMVTEKIKIINNLYNKGLISKDTLRNYYLSLVPSFKQITSTLELVNQLIILELYHSIDQEGFDPHKDTTEFVLSFLKQHTNTYRNFDWYSFHFVSQLVGNANTDDLTIASNLPANKDIGKEQLKSIIKKIVQQVKFYNTSKLVQQQIEVLKTRKEIKNVEKFFIEIRVNEMVQFQPILVPFNRLPHFSNLSQKIVVNSLSSEELDEADVRLQKRLMNMLGWRVINLNSSMFAELSLNERLKLMGEKLIEQTQAVKMVSQKIDLLLQNK